MENEKNIIEVVGSDQFLKSISVIPLHYNLNNNPFKDLSRHEMEIIFSHLDLPEVKLIEQNQQTVLDE